MSAEAGVAYEQRGWWRRQTFLDDLTRQARRQPNKLAVAARRVTAGRTDTLDYSELAATSERFARGLAALGVRPGEVVAVQLSNRWEMAALAFACMRVGAVICPIAPVCPEDELRHRLTLTGARVCITLADWDGHQPADGVLALRDSVPSLQHVVVIERPDGAEGIDFEQHFNAEHAGSPLGPDWALGPDDPFVVLFTSGTTGLSKGVLHSQNTVYAAVRGYADAFLLDRGSVIAVTTPLVHYSGFGQGLLATVMVGGAVAYQDLPRADLLLDLVERYGAGLLYGPPATMRDILDAQQAEPRRVDSLRHVVVGSATVLPELVEAVRESFDARTYSVWGMSEFGPVTITRPEYVDTWPACSNGRPIGADQLRIEPLPGAAGWSAAGRLLARGASRALGYYRNQAAFDACVTEDGWFDTGDLAISDGQDGIRVLGRAGDAMVRDGEVVPAPELEAYLTSHPAIADATLVGLHERTARPRILAVVVQSGPAAPTLDELREHLRRAGRPEHFWPDRIESVDSIPRTLTGKVRKAQLRSCYEAEAS